MDVHPWRQILPELAGISPEVSSVFDAGARQRGFETGAHIFTPEDPAPGLILPLSGRIRVQRRSASGRLNTLCHLRAGDGCALSAACQLTFEQRSCEAVAETPVEVVVLPRQSFDNLMETSRAFRGFVFQACAKRIADHFVIVEETAARDIAPALAARLLDHAGLRPPETLRRSLSVDLGAPPVVVSSVLDDFERRGWLAEDGGTVDIRDPAALRSLARSAPHTPPVPAFSDHRF